MKQPRNTWKMKLNHPGFENDSKFRDWDLEIFYHRTCWPFGIGPFKGSLHLDIVRSRPTTTPNTRLALHLVAKPVSEFLMGPIVPPSFHLQKFRKPKNIQKSTCSNNVSTSAGIIISKFFTLKFSSAHYPPNQLDNHQHSRGSSDPAQEALNPAIYS